MAVKKKETTKTRGETASQTKAAAKAPKKASAAKKASSASVPVVASETTPKADTPKVGVAAKPASPKPAAPNVAAKQAAPIKLTERQLELLKAISGTKETGYPNEKKAEQKMIDVLVDKKLVKKGAKDKQSGYIRYHVSKGGEKFLASTSLGA